jgi:hypothetical protein
MRRIIQATMMAVLIVVLDACATSRTASSDAAPTSRRDIITREEIQKAQWPNAHELVRNLRPQWLQLRGRDTINGEPGVVQVVMDGVRVGGIEALRTLPLGGIAYLQYFDAITASQRWGTGFGQGAIFVSSSPR